MADSQELTEKMAEFVGTHRRILDDFARSLSNAAHFIQLAGRAMEREPEETVTMLEQIREIDLLGHLGTQYEEYRNIAGFFLPEDGTPPADSPLVAQVAELRDRYEGLVDEAERQMEAIEKLLFDLQTHH